MVIKRLGIAERSDIIRVFLNAEVILNAGDSFAGDLADVIEGNDSRQLLLYTNSFLCNFRHDLQLTKNCVERNNGAGHSFIAARRLIDMKKITDSYLHALFDLQELVGKLVLFLIGQFNLLDQQLCCTLVGDFIIEAPQGGERTENFCPVGYRHPRMLVRRFWPGGVENIRILLRDDPAFFGILAICHEILLPLCYLAL